MHTVMRHLDLRTTLTRLLGIKKWIMSEAEIAQMADQLRGHPAFHD